MKRLHNLSVSSKLTLVIMVTCSTVLVLASVALLVFECNASKAQFIRDLTVLGKVLAHNSSAAAAFDDAEAGGQTLAGLAGRDDLEAASLILLTGERVCSFEAHGRHDPMDMSGLLDGYREIGDDVIIASPVTLDGNRLGTLYLRADFGPTRLHLIALHGSILAGVQLFSLLLALVLAYRMQRIFTTPILHLAGVLQRVAEEGDYSLRATPASMDEVGRLTESFNHMLGQIQQRDTALQFARDGLEKRVEERTEELARSVSLLNATLDSTADGILAMYFGGEVSCSNAQFREMWTLTPDLLAKGRHEAFVAFCAAQVKDPEHFTARIKAIHEHPGEDAFDVIEMLDGRVVERYCKTQWMEGRSTGLVVNFRDITARRRSAEELEKAHQQLLDTSRKAGMAEVATSVLHNVGNVLNSVNVSCSLISENVRQSRITSVAKAADLLREHTEDLTTFLTTDPTGRKLPEFLGRLAQRLAEEQTLVLAELHSLDQNIEHIKDIVSMQQSLANSPVGVHQTMPIATLVEEALRMTGSTGADQSILVVRDFAEVPAVPLEKHKILQILVNLVRNARQALTNCDRPDRQLSVRIGRPDDSRLQVSVSDNGVGISRDNLTRIFAHGFTTKRDGHGFGLHSGVLAAQEMGGNLSVHSDGPGTGATFTLELPLRPRSTPSSP